MLVVLGGSSWYVAWTIAKVPIKNKLDIISSQAMYKASSIVKVPKSKDLRPCETSRPANLSPSIELK